MAATASPSHDQFDQGKRSLLFITFHQAEELHHKDAVSVDKFSSCKSCNNIQVTPALSGPHEESIRHSK